MVPEEGKIHYDTAVVVLGELNAAMEKVNDMRGGQAGTIRLSTECDTSYHWLPSFLTKMDILYPKLEVNL